METAPARMISKAQTVAKMGLLMKKSTKPALPLSSGGPLQIAPLLRSQ
jgi:hypothetical protein